MKVNKKYLEKIIREESAKILNEMADPMENPEAHGMPTKDEIIHWIGHKQYNESDIDAFMQRAWAAALGTPMGMMYGMGPLVGTAGLGVGFVAIVLLTGIFYYGMRNQSAHQEKENLDDLLDSWLRDPEKMFRDAPRMREPIRRRIMNMLGHEKAKQKSHIPVGRREQDGWSYTPDQGGEWKFVPDERTVENIPFFGRSRRD